jgi:purine-nucleoside phosphorylase
MSTHINTKPGDIAESILLPGDPMRAKYIADTFLSDVTCYNQVRGMLGFTGYYKGKRISVQGTGMGVPSISIYTHELIHEYGVKRLIRVGTCGAMRPEVNIKDVVIAMSASTDSAANASAMPHIYYAPTASYKLLQRAASLAAQKDIAHHVGSVFTSDTFYGAPGVPKVADYGALAVEMETSALYTIAAKAGVDALTILTVSDHLLTHEITTWEERQNTFNDMIEIALEAAQ